MKHLLTLALLGVFGMVLAGCEASGRVGDPSDNGADHSYKKTTTVQPDGDRTTRTETRTDR